MVFPGLVMIGLLVVAAGWLLTSQSAVLEAANESARIASLARTAPQAQAKARAAAATTLANSDHRCSSSSVVVDTSGFAVPVGQPATVTVTVACNIPLSVLGLPGLGSRTFTQTVVTDLDTWRLR